MKGGTNIFTGAVDLACWPGSLFPPTATPCLAWSIGETGYEVAHELHNSQQDIAMEAQSMAAEACSGMGDQALAQIDEIEERVKDKIVEKTKNLFMKKVMQNSKVRTIIAIIMAFFIFWCIAWYTGVLDTIDSWVQNTIGRIPKPFDIGLWPIKIQWWAMKNAVPIGFAAFIIFGIIFMFVSGMIAEKILAIADVEHVIKGAVQNTIQSTCQSASNYAVNQASNVTSNLINRIPTGPVRPVGGPVWGGPMGGPVGLSNQMQRGMANQMNTGPVGLSNQMQRGMANQMNTGPVGLSNQMQRGMANQMNTGPVGLSNQMQRGMAGVNNMSNQMQRGMAGVNNMANQMNTGMAGVNNMSNQMQRGMAGVNNMSNQMNTGIQQFTDLHDQASQSVQQLSDIHQQATESINTLKNIQNQTAPAIQNMSNMKNMASNNIRSLGSKKVSFKSPMRRR